MARHGGLKTVLRIAAGALALSGTITVAAAEPRSVTTPDGAVVTVWETRAAGPDADLCSAGSAIAYSVTGAAGTDLGLIDPTSDAAVDRDGALLPHHRARERGDYARQRRHRALAHLVHG